MQVTITKKFVGERADKVLVRHIKDVSRARLQDAFAQGQVTVNGKPIAKSQQVNLGDVLTIEMTELPPSAVEAVEGNLTVMYEDDDLLVLNKGAGMIMHPGSGTGDDTLVHFALHHTKGKLSRLGGSRRPGIVHRLDKDTTGALVLAKSDRAYLALTREFAERGVAKEYLALVKGVPELRSGSIRDPIGRNPVVRVKMAIAPSSHGKPAHTDWEVEEVFGKRAALIHCWPQTGRTHQIRVHLMHLDHPLLGDLVYGWKPRANSSANPARVMLHAAVLAFPHPADRRPMEFRVPVPEDFLATVAQLREEARRDAKAQVVKRV